MARHHRALAKALLEQDIAGIGRIVARHGRATLDAKRFPGRLCALAFAIENSADRSVAACLRLGADPNFIYLSTGGTILHAAGDTDAARYTESFLHAGADIHALDNRRNTPLHLASVTGDERLAALLLARGGNVDAANQMGTTPLHMAAWFNKVRVAAILLAHGADTASRTATALTPLQYAEEHRAAAVADLLRAHGRRGALADVHANGLGTPAAPSL